jgi:predicted branched-subunit amino acid permease
MRQRHHGRLIVFAVAHLIAMTSWAVAMRRCPELPPERRMPYFAGFALALISVAVASCPVGYYLSDAFTPLVRLGFVFLTPVYFLVSLVGDARSRLAAVALACGAAAGPLFHLASTQWSVLLTGLVGGTAAYLLQRRMRQSHA